MLICELVKALEVSADDRARWRAMQAATPEFQSPILSPEFACAVARARDDVYVAIFRRKGEPIGYLAHHRRPNRFARPAGAPFADYSALITFPSPDIDIREALAAALIDQFQVIGLVDPHGVFGEIDGEDDDAYGIDLRLDGIPVNNVNKKQTKNIGRLRRHLVETHGEIGFSLPDTNRAHFERMLALKSEQVRQNGLHDFLAAPWVSRFLNDLFTAPQDGLHGAMLTMTAGDAPVLYHFGIRLGDRMHPWVSSFEPAYSAFSPGQIFLIDCQVALKALGVNYYDLSTGQSHYKSAFCNTHFAVRNGRVYADTARARFSENVAHLSLGARRVMGRRLDHALLRLNRRMDQIACLELDLLGRARGLAYAFGNASKRLRGSDSNG